MHKYAIGEIIDIACRAGKILLESGGEIYRVEDTMFYICKAYGIDECESYATPTTIIISAIDNEGEVFSRMMRINERGVNLHKVEAVNNFSRAIIQTPIPVTEAKQKLADINHTPVYSVRTQVLATASGTSAFALIFGGGMEHVVSGIILGTVLRLIVSYLNKIQLGYFTTNLIGGAVAALGAWLLSSFGILTGWWIITLASLMQLVPGLIFTNALRDAASGDFISGITRGAEALSIVAALAGGAGATLMFLTKLGGG